VCGSVVSEPQTTAFEDERRARLRALGGRSVPLRAARSQVGVGWLSIVLPVASRGGQVSASVAHCRVSGTSAIAPGAPTMRTDAHNMGRDERRALLEERRAVVVRQMRCLAIELTDLDRQLDEIEQSEP